MFKNNNNKSNKNSCVIADDQRLDIGLSTESIEISNQCGNKTDHALTLQIYIKQHNKRIIVFNTETCVHYPSKATIFKNLGDQYIANNVCDYYFYKKFCDDTPVLHEVICDYCKILNLKYPKVVYLIFYKSIKILHFSFGFNNCLTALLTGWTKLQNKPYLDNHVSLTGMLKFGNKTNKLITQYKVFDVAGFSRGKTNLKELAESCGIKMRETINFDLYLNNNNNVLTMLNDNPLKRVSWGLDAISNAVTSFEIKKAMTLNINTILRSCLNFTAYAGDKFLFKSSNNKSNFEIPSTIGKLVVISFQNHVYNYALEAGIPLKTFKWAVTKHGFLINSNRKKDQVAMEERERMINEIDYYKQVNESHFSDFNYTIDSFNMASVPHFQRSSSYSQLYTLGFVTGGRCNNERYRETLLTNVLDMDFSSCYGSALESLCYPIGKPALYYATESEKGINLQLFLKQHEHEFVGGTWKIVVNGPLNFSQDLVYSKIESTNSYEKLKKLTSNSSSSETVSPMKEHVLFRNTIMNGVLTQDLLEVIRKVSTVHELKSWMSLEVRSAAWYPKQSKIDDIAEWTKLSISTPVREFDKWTCIDLGTFISPLLAKRKTLKNMLKDTEQSSLFSKQVWEEKKRFWSAQEKQIKLIINTLYGTIASTYFRIGNCIIADNITARPRVAIWKALKVLNGAQSITDGFAYQPSSINRLRSNKCKKPGFNSLSDSYLVQSHRDIKKVSLDGKDWDYIYSSGGIKNIDYKQLDKTVTKEINSFWERYQLGGLPFQIEHKPEKTSFRMGYWGKGSYMLYTIDNKIVVKARGYDMNDINLPELELILEGYDCVEGDILDEEKIFNSERLENTATFDKFKDKIDPNLRLKMFDNNPMFEWLFNLTFEISKLPEKFKFSTITLVSPKEWRKQYKKNSNISIRPGDFVVNNNSSFKIKATHFPNFELKDYKKKMNEMQSKKAIPYLEKYRDLSPTQILQNMLEKHKVFSSAKKVTKKKVTKKKVTKTKNSVLSKK